MMSNNRSPPLANDGRMRDFLGVNDIHDVVDHITSVLLQSVVHGAVKSGPGAIIVDPESASYIDELHWVPHMGELGEKPSGLPHRPLDYADIGNLRADVKMNQP